MKILKLHNWIPAFNRFLLLSGLFLLLVLLMRGVDLVSLQVSGKLPVSIWKLLPAAFWTDFLTFFSIIRWLAIPYLLLHVFVHWKIADAFYIVLICLYVIIAFALNTYFSETAVPLGADVYGYSLAEIKQTVGAAAGGGIPMAVIVSISAIVIVTIATIVFFFRRRIQGDRRGFWFFLFCLLLLFIPVTKQLTASLLRTEYASNIALNKTGYFLTKTKEYFLPDAGDNNMLTGADTLSNEAAADGYTYAGGNAYPFLHTHNNRNTLSGFVNTSEPQLPNIIVVVVEGLGRAFSGEGAYLGSFTPFLDSLSQSSLYWENFLSAGGRTFAVLPSILGSLPFAKNGFNELGPDYPKNLTLMNVAKHNGYRTRFIYSGSASFDKMDLFLRNQSVDSIIDKDNFGNGYEMLPMSNGGFTWGYTDEALFKKYVDATPLDTMLPRLDVLLTVSTHSPFRIPNQDYYNQLVEQRMQAMQMNEVQKKACREYRAVYASVMYMDHSLRGFFQALQQRPDYKNTIVLITGDHRLPEIPMRSKIDRYHTLLLMHSPLLQRTAKFSSISSHLDVAPSLMALLCNHPRFDAPGYTTWVGSGLDTTRAFGSMHHYPLMQTKNDLVDYVSGTWMINQGNLFKILPNLDLEAVEDEQRKALLQKGFNYYQQKNNRFIQSHTLIPDSLYNKYRP